VLECTVASGKHVGRRHFIRRLNLKPADMLRMLPIGLLRDEEVLSIVCSCREPARRGGAPEHSAGLGRGRVSLASRPQLRATPSFLPCSPSLGAGPGCAGSGTPRAPGEMPVRLRCIHVARAASRLARELVYSSGVADYMRVGSSETLQQLAGSASTSDPQRFGGLQTVESLACRLIAQGRSARPSREKCVRVLVANNSVACRLLPHAQSGPT
jgi:hypothetical protein